MEQTLSIDIISATYRTLDVTDLVREEVSGKHPPRRIEIDTWSIIPWTNPKLFVAPNPSFFVVVWRIALGNGRYTAPRTSAGGPDASLIISFEGETYEAHERTEVDVTGVWVVNATYFDCSTGFKDVTSKVSSTVSSSLTNPVFLDVTDESFGGSQPSIPQHSNQLTVTYATRGTDGTYDFTCVAGSTGSTLEIITKEPTMEVIAAANEILEAAEALAAAVERSTVVVEASKTIEPRIVELSATVTA